MSKYTVEQLKSALVEADAAGDTQSAQILADELASRQADSYIKEPEGGSWLGDAWKGLKRGAMEEFENLGGGIFAPVVPENVLKAAQEGDLSQAVWTPNAHAMRDQMAKPETTTGKVAEFVPGLVASLPGWEMGAGALEDVPALAKMAEKPLGWIADKFLKGVAGTLGADITTGESPDNALSGGVGNVIAETIFHTPKGLRLISAIIQENERDILEATNRLGITPTAAMVSARKWMAGLEDFMSKMPGGHITKMAHDKVMAGLESVSQQIKNGMGYTGDTNGLGADILDAIQKRAAAFDSEMDTAYSKMMRQAGLHQMTDTRRFVRTVESLYGVNPRAGVAEMTAPPIVRKYMAYIDAAGKTPTHSGYSNIKMSLTDARKAMKLLDDYIGTGEMADADTAAAKQMAKALREDISSTFNALGLGGDWRHLQSRYAAEQALKEQVAKVFNGVTTPDAVYRRLFGQPYQGFKPMGRDVYQAIKAVLPEELITRVGAEMFHRMGVEGAGTAGAEGAVFNPLKYLTNWNAQKTTGLLEELFEGQQGQMAQDVAKLSEGIKKASKSINFSNTASHSALWNMVSAAVLHPVTGIPALAAITGGNVLLSMVLTHPEAAQLLASAEKAHLREWVTKILPRLLVISGNDPQIKAAFDETSNQ